MTRSVHDGLKLYSTPVFLTKRNDFVNKLTRRSSLVCNIIIAFMVKPMPFRILQLHKDMIGNAAVTWIYI